MSPKMTWPRKRVKRVRRLVRSTENMGLARANAAHYLAAYRANPYNLDALSKYVDAVPEKYVFDTDFEVVTIAPEARPSLMKPCVNCGQRKPEKEFLSGEGRKQKTHFFCASCRENTTGRKWWDILNDEPQFKTHREFTVVDNRRGAQVPRAA